MVNVLTREVAYVIEKCSRIFALQIEREKEKHCKLHFRTFTPNIILICYYSISFPDPNGTQRKGTVFITGTVESVIHARAQLIVSKQPSP